MKPLNFLSDAIYITKTGERGRGVVARTAIKKNTLLEIAPVIVMQKKERVLLDQTLLHDYIFEWGESREQCCMALGYVALYNHSPRSNCAYEMNFRQQTISIRTVRSIVEGEELFINYNGDWNSEKAVWFEAL